MKRLPITALAALALLTVAPAAWSSGDHGTDAPTVTVTQWSGGLELFMEHPLLLADHAERFIIHLTVLDDGREILLHVFRTEFPRAVTIFVAVHELAA